MALISAGCCVNSYVKMDTAIGNENNSQNKSIYCKQLDQKMYIQDKWTTDLREVA